MKRYGQNSDATGRFMAGFRQGHEDRQRGRARQLCQSPRGVRPPVTKSEGHAYYHGYKDAALTERSGGTALKRYRDKHPGHVANARSGVERDAYRFMERHVGEYVDPRTDEVQYTQLAEAAAHSVDRDEWLDDETHPVWDWAIEVGDRYRPNSRGRHAPNPTAPSGARYRHGENEIEPGVLVWVSGDTPTNVKTSKRDEARVAEAISHWWGEPVYLSDWHASRGGFRADVNIDPLAYRRNVERSAYDFFKSQGGGAVGHAAETATHLARAEEEAEERGWEVDWRPSEDADISWMDERQLQDLENGRIEIWDAVMLDEDGEVISSLGEITLDGTAVGGDPYTRVVAAELALEGLMEQGWQP